MKSSTIKAEPSHEVSNPENWQLSKISMDRTYHILNGRPMYSARFDEVMSFHSPGLAPVRKGKAWFHVRPNGDRAYSHTYDRAWGFYFGLAAVVSGGEAFHINTDGEPAYDTRFSWVGNFQDGLCAVRFRSGGYGHIQPDGHPAYGDTYKYAGDFRENSAVVQLDNGMHMHIKHNGDPLNDRRFEDLGVFHKGLAPARDERGWFHIDLKGIQMYGRRFSYVEPFYNGQARVQTHNGGIQVIDEHGETTSVLCEDKLTPLQQLSDLMVGYWRSQVVHSAVELHVFDQLPASTDKLATLLSMSFDNCKRLMRALWELGLVKFTDGEWQATESGKLLEDGSEYGMRDADMNWSLLAFPAWMHLTESLKSDKVGFEAANGERFFDHIVKQEEFLNMYHNAMRTYAQHDYADVPKLINLAGVGTVADAGCGHSETLFELLKKNPRLRGILFDLPEVISGIRVPQSLQDRASTIGGDIFAKWPFQVDVILLSRVLHDWCDVDAKRILGNARNALSESGRIFVIEMALSQESPFGGLADLNLMVTCGGRERTLEEFKKLFSDAGLKLHSMKDNLRYGKIMEIGMK